MDTQTDGIDKIIYFQDMLSGTPGIHAYTIDFTTTSGVTSILCFEKSANSFCISYNIKIDIKCTYQEILINLIPECQEDAGVKCLW